MFAAQVRVDPQDNIWAVDEMTNMVIKFDPQGRVALLLGRKAEGDSEPAARGVDLAAAKAAAAAAGSRSRRAAGRLQPPDRRGVGRAGQHLRRRRPRATRASPSSRRTACS